MKAVILAGGLGTRFAEETSVKPKPMIEVGGKPILWHIMKIYYAQGIREFIICCGYKGYIIKEFFSNYWLHNSDVTFNTGTNEYKIHDNSAEDWSVTLVDTGLDAGTGGRLRRIRQYLGDEDFCFTYGDGVSDVRIEDTLKIHNEAERMVTVTAVQPESRFGALEYEGTVLTSFEEKPSGEGGWINGGYFIVSPKAIDYIDTDQTHWEQGPLQKLVADDQVNISKHHGFWKSMDTLRDKQQLERIWNAGNAPWKIWD